MAARSLRTWRALSSRSGRILFNPIGVLWLTTTSNVYAERSRAVLRKLAIPFDDLSQEDLAKRYPQIRCSPATTAIFEPESGALMAREAVGETVAEFIKAGGSFKQVSVKPQKLERRLSDLDTSAGTLSADTFVFACGPWLPKLFPELLGRRIFPTRQEVLFFGTPPGDLRFAAPTMPVWIDFSDSREMYGFPSLEGRGFKVAFDKHGPAFDPDTGNRVLSADKVAEARVYLRHRFPTLADMPVVESRVCQYENTSNGDFLIDRHPAADNVWLVGGGSGHGFKHGPAVGEYVAARIAGEAQPAVEPRFSLASKATKQNRSVH
jgi:sarcosine oxidase